MNYPALLIALLVDRLFRDAAAWRDFGWLRRYLGWLLRQRWIQSLASPGWLAAVAILPLALATAWLQFSIVPLLGSFSGFVFDTAILFLCLGPRDLGDDATRLVDALGRGDTAAVDKLADTCLPSAHARDAETDPLSSGLFIGICQRYIGPLFWFATLGPFAALTYRLAEQIRHAPDTASPELPGMDRLFSLLEWIPVRLCAAGFAIAGHFDAVASAWKDCSRDGDAGRGDYDLLLATGQAALGEHEESSPLERVEAALALAWRTLTLWVAILGIAYLLSLL